MSKKEKKEAEKTLWVTHEESRSGGGSLHDCDDDRWSSREDEYVDFKVTGVYMTSDGALYGDTVRVDFEPKDGQDVHVVVVRYGTGDTFGHTDGCGHIEGVYADDKLATKIGEAIHKGYDSKDGGKHYSGKSYGEYRMLKGTSEKDAYYPWEGYFESLQGVEIHTFTLGKKPSVRRIRH